jgi:hypothetical protein
MRRGSGLRAGNPARLPGAAPWLSSPTRFVISAGSAKTNDRESNSPSRLARPPRLPNLPAKLAFSKCLRAAQECREAAGIPPPSDTVDSPARGAPRIPRRPGQSRSAGERAATRGFSRRHPRAIGPHSPEVVPATLRSRRLAPKLAVRLGENSLRPKRPAPLWHGRMCGTSASIRICARAKRLAR